MQFYDENTELYNDTIHGFKVKERFITDQGLIQEFAFYEFNTYIALTFPAESIIVNKELLPKDIYCPDAEIKKALSLLTDYASKI